MERVYIELPPLSISGEIRGKLMFLNIVLSKCDNFVSSICTHISYDILTINQSNFDKQCLCFNTSTYLYTPRIHIWKGTCPKKLRMTIPLKLPPKTLFVTIHNLSSSNLYHLGSVLLELLFLRHKPNSPPSPTHHHQRKTQWINYCKANYTILAW